MNATEPTQPRTHALIEGHLTWDRDEMRYKLDGAPAFAAIATLIRTTLTSEDMPAIGPENGPGLDFGNVRITIEVLPDEGSGS